MSTYSHILRRENIPVFPFSIKSALRHSGFLFLTNVIERALFFLLFVLLARKLPADEYGAIITAFAFANILSSVFEFGFPAYFQRESASGSPQLNDELNTAIGFRLRCLILFMPISIIYLSFICRIDLDMVILISLTIYLFNFNVFLNSVLYGKGLYRQSFYLIMSGRMIIAAMLVLYFLFSPKPELVILTFAISSIIHYCLISSVLKRNSIRLRSAFNVKILRIIFRSSLPVSIGTVFVWLYDRIDVLIIQNIISYEAVAVYSAAYSIYKLPQAFAGIFLIPMFSNLSGRYSQNKFIEIKEIGSITVIILAASLGVCLPLSLFPEKIISVFYGSKYLSSSAPLLYLLIAVPGIVLNNLTGVIANSVRKEKYPVYAAVPAALLNIALCIALVPVYGITGAIIAAIAAEYTIFIIEALLLLKLNTCTAIFR